MLWIALHLPHLSSEARSPSPEALASLAAWAGRFTPSVSLEGDCGLLLEVATSLKLFGGLRAIFEAMRTDLAAMGYTAQLACAPTARAAWWLARSGTQRAIGRIDSVEPAIAALPIELLDCGDKPLATLRGVGVRTIGEVLALPRAGLARRFGQAFLDELDRALGKLAEPRDVFVPLLHFRARLELVAETSEADRLAHAAERLLVQLGGFLAARTGAISGFTLTLVHRDKRATAVPIGLVAPSRDSKHFMLLLRERLGRVPLAEPVRALVVSAEDIVALDGANLPLLCDDTRAVSQWPQLVERLRARLGADNVHGLALAADHRPERASCTCEPGRISPAVAFGLRPLWLLRQPRALAEIDGAPHDNGRLHLLTRPERIETGWWDGDFVARDYFVAQTPEHALVWIFRTRPANAAAIPGWYLHGFFA